MELSEKELIQALGSQIPGVNSRGADVFPEPKIYFEPVSTKGLREMDLYSRDERFYEFFEFEPFSRLEQTEEYLNRLIAYGEVGRNGLPAKYWFVRETETSQLCGTAGLLNLDCRRQSVEWGFGIDPEKWGRGYILYIQEFLKHYAFEVLKLRRLHGKTMVSNERTINMVLSAGFQKEGVLRDFYRKGERFIDAIVYSMLSTDYQSPDSDITGPSDRAITRKQVVQLVSEVLSDDTITFETTVANCVPWDSINHISILLEVKQRFHVNIPPDLAVRVDSVRQLYEVIASSRD